MNTKTISQRMLSAVICMAFLLMLFHSAGYIPASALTMTYTPSASYQSSKYYSQLLAVNLTGDQRTDIVNVAMSQYGYYESNSASNLSGTTSGSGNYTEYGYWFGLQDAWCAMFIAWCAEQAQIPTSIIQKQATASGKTASSTNGYFGNTFKSFSSYTPSIGDIAYYDTDGDGISNHVEIVSGVTSSMISTIGGNTNDGKQVYTHNVSASTGGSSGFKIIGYECPNYDGSVIEPLATPTITTDKSAYTVGDTVYLSWAASPSNSNLSHYWLTIDAPDGTRVINETMNLNTSYSFTVTQAGNYSVTASATPQGSSDGSGSLTDTAIISVSPNTYTIYFDPNGGSCTTTSQTVSYGNTYGTLPTPTRTGHTFDGWYTASSGGYLISEDTVVSLSSDQTLYARWSAATYTITFMDYSGDGAISEKTVTYGSTYGTLPTLEKEGYAFEGWYTEFYSGTRVFSYDIVDITSDCELYAHWTVSSDIPSYPVTEYYADLNFDGVYDISDSSIIVQAANGEKELTTLEMIYADLNADGVLGQEDLDIITRIFTYKITDSVVQDAIAKWKKRYVDYDYYIIAASSNEIVNSLAQGQTYGTLPTPAEKTGYTFDGWYTDKEILITSSDIFTLSDYSVDDISVEQVYIYDYWTANNYTVSFDVNDYSIPYDEDEFIPLTSKTVTFGSGYGTLPTPTRAGFTFEGWYLWPDDITVTNTTTVETAADHTLHALWGKINGDVNRSNNVTLTDAVLLQKHLLNNTSIDNVQFQLADINSDGSVNAFDLALLKQILLTQ